jgi:AcrR family transcriptional regulator
MFQNTWEQKSKKMETDIKQQILDKSVELFAQYGIRSVSIDDVCQQLKISKKTFYVHYRQKEDLVTDVVREQCKAQVDKLRSLLSGKTALQILMEFIRTPQKFKPSVAQQEKHRAVVHDLKKFYPTVWERQQQFLKQIEIEGIGELLRHGICEGDFRSDLDVDLYLLFFQPMTDVFLENIIKPKVNINGRVVTKQRLYDFYLDLFMRQIISEQGLKKLGISPVDCTAEAERTTNNSI